MAGSTSEFWFPFPRYPDDDWHLPNKNFGAGRQGGRRLHGGCDLIMPPFEWIHAVYDGVLVHEETLFYNDTYYVTYQHGSYLIRYGEIEKNSSTKKKVGDTCKRGEKICQVGLMTYKDKKTGKKVRYPANGPRGHMLHLEMYANGADHSRLKATLKTNPYERRKDIIDPTPHLDDWVKRLSPP
jgi:murein DD-endopeptidase MepM/ murein hydrolase activator NlpD